MTDVRLCRWAAAAAYFLVHVTAIAVVPGQVVVGHRLAALGQQRQIRAGLYGPVAAQWEATAMATAQAGREASAPGRQRRTRVGLAEMQAAGNQQWQVRAASRLGRALAMAGLCRSAGMGRQTLAAAVQQAAGNWTRRATGAGRLQERAADRLGQATMGQQQQWGRWAKAARAVGQPG